MFTRLECVQSNNCMSLIILNILKNSDAQNQFYDLMEERR